MSAVKEQILQLLDELPSDELEEVAEVVHVRAQARAQANVDAHLTVRAEGHVTAPLTSSSSSLRWPHLGPVAVGAAVLLGWIVGIVGGPLLAGAGAAAGLMLGDQIDQRTATADA